MRNQKGFTLVELVVGIFIVIVLIIFMKSCMGCCGENKPNTTVKTEQVPKVEPQKKVEKVVETKEVVKSKVKETSTNKTWSELLKSKPKEMQDKQEMLKSSLKKMSNN